MNHIDSNSRNTALDGAYNFRGLGDIPVADGMESYLKSKPGVDSESLRARHVALE